MSATDGAPGTSVLFVDDEPILTEYAAEALRIGGYRVTALCDPGMALRRLAEHPRAYDVLVTDYLMPGVSGFELAEQALAACGDLKVVLTTGYLTAEVEREAGRIGIHAVLMKPFMPDELFATLARLSGAGRAAPQ